jgi:hypothetical protein
MVGEFYGRTLSNVYALLTAKDPSYYEQPLSVSNNENTTFIEKIYQSKEETQFYVHIPLGNKQILDAHKLLLAGMLPPSAARASKNNAPFHSVRWAKAALELVRPQKENRFFSASRSWCFADTIYMSRKMMSGILTEMQSMMPHHHHRLSTIGKVTIIRCGRASMWMHQVLTAGRSMSTHAIR